MNRPTHVEYVLGSMPGFAACAAILGLVGYEALQDRMPIILVFIAFALFTFAGSANRKVRDYANWQRDWNAMGDPSRREDRG